MTRRVAWMLVTALSIAPMIAAGQPPAPEAPQAEPAPPPRPDAAGQPVNVRVALVIIDETAGMPAETKTVSLLAADGTSARVRAEGQVQRAPGRGVVPVQLNVDAMPQITPDGLVRLMLNLQHQLERSGAEAEATHPTRLVEGLTVFLRSGVPLVISEAVDPVTGRKTTVEVTATVLK
jgi:hypothetical protein